MRHQKTRHKLSRSASHRKSLLRNLTKEVIDHEPHVSFFGGPDGLNIVRRLIRELPTWLAPGGRYAQECDPSQIDKVLALLTEAGFLDAKSHRDAEGIERVVSAGKAV